jgi:glycosyltransferase involved in cell wall biosynthesis
MPMRIAIIAPFHDFGGSENQILLLLRGLRRQGVEFVFFHLHIRSPELLNELEEIPDCKHVEIRFRSVKNLFLLFLDALSLAKLLRIHKCILAHCWNYPGHIIGGVASKMARIPCIFSIRGLDSWKKNRHLLFYRLLNRLAKGFVFQSTTQREFVRKREWIPLKRTQIIINGVDPQRFQAYDRRLVRAQIRKEMGLASLHPLVLSVGSLRLIKGHDVLIRAVRRLRKEQPDVLFHVLIVGDGPLREEYEQIAKELPITFAGFQKDVEKYYLAADIYCQPSRSEGLPNAVIEAMCSALPIVASDVGGIADLVTVGNGLLFKPGEPESLTRQLYKLLVHREMWPLMSSRSLELCERFSAEKMVNSHIAAYNGFRSRYEVN